MLFIKHTVLGNSFSKQYADFSRIYFSKPSLLITFNLIDLVMIENASFIA